MDEKSELMVMAFKQRIGQLTSEYEGQLAQLRVEATMEINRLNEELTKAHVELETYRGD
jgi:hypothetical protein